MAAECVPYDGPIVTRAEAKAAGLKRYFTGKPCKHGHVVERSTVNGTCLVCSDITTRAAAAKSPERRSASKRAWYEANKAKHNADVRSWRKQNRERWREWTRQWLLKHEEKLRAKREKRAPANVLRVKMWRKANPEKATATDRNCRVRRAGAEGRHTAAEIADLFVKQRGRCAYCRAPIKNGYHADHITPLKRGGSNWIANIQLTCAPCNTRKNAADPIDFARRVGLLI